MHMPQPQCRAPAAEKLRPSSGRKPLQPRNSPATPIPVLPRSKPKGDLIEIYSATESNKENLVLASPIPASPAKVEPILDSSLAEELSAVKKKLERLRLDREKTEQTLRERDTFLEAQMKEIERRGEVQKTLEIEVDRLYRLKQLHISCMRVSPIRSLREKQQHKRTTELQPVSFSFSQELKSEEMEESVGETAREAEADSPCSISSESLIEK
ncbi:uncharacterized protein LOC116207985 [Punica granatum]|uniref:Uncharacterized protein LOC116207985 n=1 Tax=Punica granatum TaxID=22663 RepID=A0A6P8DXE8_PUNGR|nr:uncharacterized protein LOC116207985 [Punica granatum]